MSDKEMSDKRVEQKLREGYLDLIRGFCKLNKLDDAAGIVEGRSIEVDGVMFSLMYEIEKNPDLVFIYTEYGAIPEDKASAAYSVLLELNLQLHRSHSGTFAASPRTKKIVLSEHFPLMVLTPEMLSDLLAHGAVNANKWRAGFFLEGDQAAVQQTLVQKAHTKSARNAMRNFLPPKKKNDDQV